MRIFKVLISGLVLFVSCSKSGGSGSSQPAPEPAIVFSTDASNGSVSPGGTFPVTVTLSSAMPSSQGIKIEATVIDQTNNMTITQNPAMVSTTTKNTINLIGLPQQHWCSATIKVSSVATATNNSTQTFTVVYK